MENTLEKIAYSNRPCYSALYDPKTQIIISAQATLKEYNEIFTDLQKVNIGTNDDMLILLDFRFRVHSDPQHGHLASHPLVQYHDETLTKEEMYKVLETSYVSAYVVPTYKALKTAFSVQEHRDRKYKTANVYTNTFYSRELETVIQNSEGFSINRFLLSDLM